MEIQLANGLKVAYQSFGQGASVLICIMGLAASKDLWSPTMMKALAEGRQVIIFDNRGVGGTHGPKAPISIRLLADDLAQLMDALNIKKADILGVSLGGMIAQSLAVHHPDRVGKLVLVSTGSRFKGRLPNPVVLSLPFLRLAPQVFGRVLFTPEFMQAHSKELNAFSKRLSEVQAQRGTMLRQLLAALNFDISRELRSLTNSTLVLAGEKDPIIACRDSEEIARSIPGAKLVVYKGMRHGFMLERQAEVISQVQAFLQG